MGAVTAALMFGLNSQILLHGRRAMSEAGLLFGMILVVAVLLEQRKNAGRCSGMRAGRCWREPPWPSPHRRNIPAC